MAALFGHTWTSAYGDNPRSIAGAEWARTLAGLSRAEVEAGLDVCRVVGAEWPPSAPRFRAMCLGIPSFARVKDETLRSDAERSPFTRLVWGHVDGYAHRHADTRTADKILREAYDRAVEDRMSGTPLPDVVAVIEQQAAPKPEPPTPEQVEQHLAEIRTALGLSLSEAAAMGEEGLRMAGGEQ